MSQTVVMKFGGTSVGSSERIGAVAERVADHVRKTGDRVVVVVSAMSGETDRLIELCRKVSGETRSQREYDQLLTAGEHVSTALMAMALKRAGLKSQSLLAHQVQVHTAKSYGQHLITGVDTEKLTELLDASVVPVVAGFQGVDDERDFTTLGRGGSDTTAVALAAALDSCRCFIFTDVEGVFSALPQVCKRAVKLDQLTYEEMLELAGSGAKVLQTRSVNLARKFQVPLIVANSFSEASGTSIVEEYEGMEDSVVSGITYKTDQAIVRVRDFEDRPGVAAKIFSCVADAGIVVDMIVNGGRTGGHAAVSFTVAQTDVHQAHDVLSALLSKSLPEASLETEKEIAQLAVVGEGMKMHAGVAAQMFEVLGREGINIRLITTSEIKVTIAIDQKYAELAVRALHEYFVERKEA